MSAPMPIPDFTYPDHLQRFAVTGPAAYLAENPTLSGVIVSAVVVHPFSRSIPIQNGSRTWIDKVLVVQRAATDGFPLRWETPGGGIDHDDNSILSALQRELREETGLYLGRAAGLLEEGTEWKAKGGGRWRKVTFLVTVQSQEGNCFRDWEPWVVLNPFEHVAHVWASSDEIERGECRGRKIVFAYREGKEIALRGLRVGWETAIDTVIER